ncbi:TPA: DUF551 domain-containing protein [Klebsiella pneumoniae]|nr:DUF551 domain-containing protein [Klebsiella pneumoniae]
MKFEEWLSQQNGVIEVDCGCVTSEAFYHWMRVAYEAGNSPVIPDGSASMLRRWLAFGRGMQNAGSQLPHNLIAETEAMLAAAPQSPGSEPATVPGKWIPVSERLPENKPGGYEYLVFETLNGCVNHDYWAVPDTGQEFTPFWNRYGDYVTHWMPLPAAPQEVSDA